ncbi:alpha/beta fold hydrolase [Desulfosporosinus sp. SYSU MS00001]|uniref:alpha/beta fold hydrolase n=1 Tax=Desulfosporosinus sp. SYSU MS00001 TaxID=3416284 RepID=UPI003CF17809
MKEASEWGFGKPSSLVKMDFFKFDSEEGILMPFFRYEGVNVYYKVVGKGNTPLLFLHGNTASSKMFKPKVKFYAERFRVILIDYPGHGKSEMLQEFPVDYWCYNARVAIKLCQTLKCNKVNLIGTSGGAIVALNMVLIEPLLVGKIIADSFPGESQNCEDIVTLRDQRKKAKGSISSVLFWFLMHGLRWKKVVDADTKMIELSSLTRKGFYCGDLSEITVPVLITGSLKDELIKDMEFRMETLSNRLKNSKLVFYPTGSHPAMFSNSREFDNLALEFLEINC